jgi:phosphohistidine phosphatase
MPTLLLVRHAIAEERGEAWPDDTRRPLTPKGAARMREIAARLQAMGETANLILTSPLVRAVQTAAILADVWRPTPAMIIVDALSPGESPAVMSAALRAAHGHACVAAVGHEPEIGEWAAWLIGATAPLPFKKGGVARIDVPAWPPSHDGQLQWLATPRILRPGS